MENQNNNPALNPDAPIDQNKLDAYKENLRTEQDFTKAILAGAVAAIIGAALWGLITSLTGYQIGYMALGVGFLVGMAIRYAGKGIDPEGCGFKSRRFRCFLAPSSSGLGHRPFTAATGVRVSVGSLKELYGKFEYFQGREGCIESLFSCYRKRHYCIKAGH